MAREFFPQLRAMTPMLVLAAPFDIELTPIAVEPIPKDWVIAPMAILAAPIDAVFDRYGLVLRAALPNVVPGYNAAVSRSNLFCAPAAQKPGTAACRSDFTRSTSLPPMAMEECPIDFTSPPIAMACVP